MLAREMEGCPAGDEYLQPGCSPEQVRDERSPGRDVLEVVEEQEHLLVAKVVAEGHRDRPALGLADAERLRDFRSDEAGVADESERDPEDPGLELVAEPLRSLEPQAGLARASRGRSA